MICSKAEFHFLPFFPYIISGSALCCILLLHICQCSPGGRNSKHWTPMAGKLNSPTKKILKPLPRSYHCTLKTVNQRSTPAATSSRGSSLHQQRHPARITNLCGGRLVRWWPSPMLITRAFPFAMNPASIIKLQQSTSDGCSCTKILGRKDLNLKN